MSTVRLTFGVFIPENGVGEVPRLTGHGIHNERRSKSDQQEKCNLVYCWDMLSLIISTNTEKSHSKLLMGRRLPWHKREEKTTIILFVSPQQLKKDSKWYYSVLLDVALRGCVSAVYIDEVHSTVQNVPQSYQKKCLD